jgi:hypothetical protein
MTVTTAETLAVNGVVLNTLAKNIEALTGRLKVGNLRTENVSVPGRHGTLRTSQKFYDEGVIVLPMWVRGCNDDGLVTTTARREFYSNLDALSRLFRPGDGMLEVVHTLPDTTSRRVMAEVTEVIDFSVVEKSGDMPLGKFSVAMRVPGVFWEDTIVNSIDMLPTQNGQVAGLDGMTAPLEDGVFTITGPATNPKVEALYNGASLATPNWFQYSGTIPGSQTLTVDCGNWTLTGGGGFTPNYANFSHVGGARWLTIVAAPAGQSPGLKITASSTTGATKVNLTARRKYLVG